MRPPYSIFATVRASTDEENRLKNGINVSDKVDCSGACSLDGGMRGIFIGGKVSASGAIDITGPVEIVGPIKSSGRIHIRSGGEKAPLKLGSRVECSGACLIEGNVETT